MFHVHQRLNQIWKNVILFKLLKDQTLSYKLLKGRTLYKLMKNFFCCCVQEE